MLDPGVYDLGTDSLILDAEFIDIVGKSGSFNDVLITSDVSVAYGATVQHQANDAVIKNVTIRNTQTAHANNTDSSDPAAYCPSTID